MNKMAKIRTMLDCKDYHLSEDSDGNWVLYYRYEDLNLYFDDNNKPIMTSKDSNINDLYKYAKKHRSTNIGDLTVQISFISIVLIWITMFCTITLNLMGYTELSSYFLLAQLTILLMQIIISFLSGKACKRKYRVMYEKFCNKLKIKYGYTEGEKNDTENN